MNGPDTSANADLASNAIFSDTMDAFGNRFEALPLILGDCVPANVTNKQFTIPDIDFMTWNKVQSSALALTPDSAAYPIQPNMWDGSTRYISQQCYAARTYAATMSLFYSLFGQSVASWNTPQNNTMVAIPNFIRGVYASESPFGLPRAVRGSLFASLHAAAIGCNPADMTSNYTLYDVRNPTTAGIASPVGPQTAQNANPEFTMVNPTILCDVWLQKTCKNIPKALSPFLGPNLFLRGMPDPNSQCYVYSNQVGGGASVPIPMNWMTPTFPPQSFSIYSDAHLWNSRLARLIFFDAQLKTRFGNVVAGQPPALHYIVQRPPRVGLFLQNILTCTVNRAATAWMPIMTVNGDSITISVGPANANPLYNLMSGNVHTGVSSWLFSPSSSGPTTLNVGPCDADPFTAHKATSSSSSSSSSGSPSANLDGKSPQSDSLSVTSSV